MISEKPAGKTTFRGAVFRDIHRSDFWMIENNSTSRSFSKTSSFSRDCPILSAAAPTHWHDRKHVAKVADTHEFAPHDLFSTEVLSNCLLNMIKQDKSLEANIPLRTALEKYVLDTAGEEIRKFSKFCKPKYVRKMLAVAPAFNIQIESVPRIAREIQTLFDVKNDTATTEDFTMRKEDVPFVCVINPPRHGKTLLLDTIYRNDDRVLVVTITYSTGSTFFDDEIVSVECAVRYFWLRVLKRLINSDESLSHLYEIFSSRK
jgi:hypothetical protein